MRPLLLPLSFGSGLVFASGVNLTAQEILGFGLLPLVFFTLRSFNRILLLFYTSVLLAPVFAGGIWFFGVGEEYARGAIQPGMRFNPDLAFFVVTAYLLLLVGSTKICHDMPEAKQRLSLRIYIYLAGVVSLYCAYGLFGVYMLGLPDVVPSFLDGRNFRPTFSARQSGFSDEPGDLAFLLGSALLTLITVGSDIGIRKHSRYFLVIAIVLCLLLSSSTLAVAIPVAYVAAIAILRGRIQAKNLAIGGSALVVFVAIVYLFGNYFRLGYFFIDKFEQVFSFGADVTRSASLRGYHWVLALEGIMDNPLGVGAGNAIFVTDNYDFLDISALGYAASGAKSGLLQWILEGGWLVIPLIAMFIGRVIVRGLRFNHPESREWGRLLIAQAIFTIICLNALPSFYKLWIWLPLVTVLGICDKRNRYGNPPEK